MIYGRKQRDADTDIIWDYVACLYPEGNISTQQMYLFNHDQIDQVYFIGFQDREELKFAEEYLTKEA